MTVLPARMYVHHVCLVPTGQKSVPDPLKLELGMVVSYHVGDGS